MVEVQVAVSHLEDRHLFVVPVDPRVIVVPEDGWPGDGPDDGDDKEEGPEGSVSDDYPT